MFGLVAAWALASGVARAEETPAPAARVHIAGSESAALERRIRGTDAWVTACTAPCDVELPLADEYRIRYDRGSSSPPFGLRCGTGDAITLSVEPPTVAGEVLLGAGAVVTAVGVGVLVWAKNQPVQDPCVGRDHCDAGVGPAIGQAMRVLLGAVVVVMGLSVGLGGAIVTATAEPHVKQEPGLVREPTWGGPRASLDKSAIVVPLGFSF